MGNGRDYPSVSFWAEPWFLWVRVLGNGAKKEAEAVRERQGI
jgi:hypothetical protein